MLKLAWNTLLDAVEPLADRRNLRIAAAVTALLLLSIPFELGMKPHARQFRLDNPYINYPMSPDHVPVPLLAFLSVCVPLGSLLAVGSVDSRKRRNVVISVLGLFLAISSTIFIVDVLKVLIGNQRPDFIARCQPKSNTPRDKYVSVLDVCTNSNMMVVWEGCKSTPSGHSALSFSGLGFLGFWIIFSYDLFQRDRPLYIKASGFAPFLLALYVALTRIVDHKHHWVDIISGSILGTMIAYASHVYVVASGNRLERPNAYSSV